MYFLYLPHGLSGVTKYYVEIFVDALKIIDCKSIQVSKLNDIPKRSNIITICDKDSAYAALTCNPKRLITWFQGIVPEEMGLIYRGCISRIPRILIHRFFEKYSLMRSTLNIFVSNEMLAHYKKHYGYNNDNYIIMPCFGNQIDPSAFVEDKYKSPKFLYSGSLHSWQCIDKMILLFKKIKEHIPNASLDILTPELDEARDIAAKYNVKANIDFVRPDKLQDHIKQFKYGFIVRDDIAINRVSTPTKMSNYMGAGIIPVYSDVIVDYQHFISKNNPMVIPFKSDEECISKILDMESRDISSKQLLKYYSDTFNCYWNRQMYINKIASVIKEL